MCIFEPKRNIWFFWISFHRRGGSDQGSVSLSSFCLLYSELVQYHQSRVASISELERRLESAGYGVGFRVLELLAYRSREVRKYRSMTKKCIIFFYQLLFKFLWKQNAHFYLFFDFLKIHLITHYYFLAIALYWYI